MAQTKHTETELTRLARALVRMTGPEGCGAGHGNYDELGEGMKELYKGLVRAVLREMLEPSEEANAEGRGHILLYRNGYTDAAEAVTDIWKAMLSTILNEEGAE